MTQLIDSDDPVLGFVVPQIRELAAHVELVVIANEVRCAPDDLGADVISLGKERSARTTVRGARYVSMIGREIMRRRPAAIVAHMCPIYLVLAAPLARLSGVPTMLWYVHPANTLRLRTAERLADAIITAFPGSYPRSGPKVRPIGHAIDTDAFAWSPIRSRQPGSIRLLALGRTSPVKGYDLMIRAVATAREAGVDAELRIVGPSVTPLELHHREQLQVLAERRVPGAVRFESGVSPADVPELLRQSDVVLNATESGSADKVVFEAMAAGRPVLVCSSSFDPLLGEAWTSLSFPRHDVLVLAHRICELASTATASLEGIGLALRQRVQEEHSLRHWATSVERLATELSA